MSKYGYDLIANFDNLYDAHLNLRKGKTSKREMINYELGLTKNLYGTFLKLKNKTYKPKGYYSFIIKEPKEREVFAAYYQDRVVIRALCDHIIKPLISKRLIYDNAACQIDKGSHFSLKRLTHHLTKYYKKHGNEGYILKCDISKYFPSINQKVLKDKLSKIIDDKVVLALTFQFIDSFHTPGRPGFGIPLGNHTSQWFALYYLDSIDRFIKEKCQIKHYVRYMDDLIIIHHDKDFLRDLLQKITYIVEEELKLTLNHKTQITTMKNGVEFLGWRFYLTSTGKVIKKLKNATKSRIKRRIRKLDSDYEKGLITDEKVINVFASYRGHLIHGMADSMIKYLDQRKYEILNKKIIDTQ